MNYPIPTDTEAREAWRVVNDRAWRRESAPGSPPFASIPARPGVDAELIVDAVVGLYETWSSKRREAANRLQGTDLDGLRAKITERLPGNWNAWTDDDYQVAALLYVGDAVRLAVDLLVVAGPWQAKP